MGETVELVLDPLAGERGFFGRLLAYVLVAGEDLNSILVREGYARVYEEGEASRLRIKGVSDSPYRTGP